MHRLISVLLACVVAPALAAQDVAGRLEGHVSTEAGAVDQVTIAVRSDNLIGERQSRTNTRGWFAVHALPPGAYRVEVRRIGYRSVTIEGVRLRAGETTRLDIRVLATAQALEPLVVRGDAVQVDPTGTANIVTFTDAQLRELPLGRDFRQVIALAPMATPSFLGDEGNIAGGTGYENNYYVDGVNITSPIRGNTSANLPYNFIRHMDVRTGGATAHDAQALGGVINVVTPTGGDRFSGTAFTFMSNAGLQEGPRLGAGQHQTGFASYDAGLTLSGPLVPHRASFYAAYNPKYEERVERYPFGDITDIRRQHQFAAKVTTRLRESTTLVATALGDPTRHSAVSIRPLLFGVPQNREPLESTDRTNTLATSLRLQNATRFGALEAHISQLNRLEFSEPRTAAGNEPAFVDVVTGTISGGRGARNRYTARARTADVRHSMDLGTHTLSTGARYESLRSDLLLTTGGPWGGGEVTRRAVNAFTWHWFFTDGGGRIDVRQPAVFLHDVWRVHSRLTLSLGARYGSQQVMDLSTSSRLLRIDEGVQPRIGAVLHLGSRGTQRLFASYARAADQVAGWLGFIVAANVECTAVFAQDPRIDTTGGTAQCPPPYAITRSRRSFDVRAQTTDELSLGYERRLGPLTGRIRLLGRDLADGVHNVRDTARVVVIGNPGRGALSHFPRPRRQYRAVEVGVDNEPGNATWYRVSYVLSRNRGNYPGIYTSDWRVPSAHFGPLYIHPAQHHDADGLLPNDRTHVFKAYGATRIAGRAYIGANVIAASGTPLSEYGAIPFPFPFRGFATPRGTAGRTPWLWEAAIRGASELPWSTPRRTSRLILDVEHLSTRRPPVDFDQIHYTCLSAGQQSCPNAGYGRATQYAPPMRARVGLEVEFR